MLKHITYIICIIYFLKQKKKRFTKKIDLFVFMNYIVGIGIQSLASQLFMIL